ncbi:MAG: hypothetical protein JRD89_02785 [Deltaproteobacteria bacterium]|nr:hypothetical protein [Deltaproteobacteria bacterium]
MSGFGDFIRDSLKEHASQLHVAFLAMVVRFNAREMWADIQPLEIGLPLITKVPVAIQRAGPFYFRVPYQPGDIVVAVCSDTGIDKMITTGLPDLPLGKRRHKLDDAIIIGGITPFTNPLPAEETDSVILAKRDLSAKIILRPDNNIIIETDGTIYLGSENATEGASLGTSLKAWLDGHTHSGVAPGTASTGSPTSSSPAPSSKVILE